MNWKRQYEKVHEALRNAQRERDAISEERAKLLLKFEEAQRHLLHQISERNRDGQEHKEAREAQRRAVETIIVIRSLSDAEKSWHHKLIFEALAARLKGESR